VYLATNGAPIIGRRRAAVRASRVGADTPGVRWRPGAAAARLAGRGADPRSPSRQDVDEVPRDGRVDDRHRTHSGDAETEVVRDGGTANDDARIIAHEAETLTAHVDTLGAQAGAGPRVISPARERHPIELDRPVAEHAVRIDGRLGRAGRFRACDLAGSGDPARSEAVDAVGVRSEREPVQLQPGRLRQRDGIAAIARRAIEIRDEDAGRSRGYGLAAVRDVHGRCERRRQKERSDGSTEGPAPDTGAGIADICHRRIPPVQAHRSPHVPRL